MRIEELSVGNCLHLLTKDAPVVKGRMEYPVVKVEVLHPNRISFDKALEPMPIKHFHPIPLGHELLSNLGFDVVHRDRATHYRKSGIQLIWAHNKEHPTFEGYTVKSLHTLQNIHVSLNNGRPIPITVEDHKMVF